MRVFTFFIHHRDNDTPTLLVEVATDLSAIRDRAQRALGEADDRTSVEVREDDLLLFTLDGSGVRWPQVHRRDGTPRVKAGCETPP